MSIFFHAAAMFGAPTGADRPQDLFAIVANTGSNINTAIFAVGFDPGMVASKDISSSTAQWICRDSVRGWSNNVSWSEGSAPTTFSGYSGSNTVVAYVWKEDPKSFAMEHVSYNSGSLLSTTMDLLFDIGMFQVRRVDSSGSWRTWQQGMTSNTTYTWNDNLSLPSSVGIWANGKTIHIAAGVLSTGTYAIYAWPKNPDLYKFGSLQVAANNQGAEQLSWVPQFYLYKNPSIAHTQAILDTMTSDYSWPVGYGETVVGGDATQKTPSDTTTPAAVSYVVLDVANSAVNRLSNTNLLSWTVANGAAAGSSTTFTLDSSSNDSRIFRTFTGVTAGESMVLQATLSGAGTIRMGIYEEVSSGVFANTERLVTLSATPTVYRMGRLMRNGQLSQGVRFGRGVNGQSVSAVVANISLFSDRNDDAAATVHWSRDGSVTELAFDPVTRVMTLSNSNMTATAPDTDNNRAYGSSDTTKSHGAGKFAFEVRMDVVPAGTADDIALGWITNAFNRTEDTFLGNNDKGWGVYGGVGWWGDGSLKDSSTSSVSWAQGARYQVLFDMVNNKCWVTKDGITYYGEGSYTKSQVASGTGGFRPFVTGGIGANTNYTPVVHCDSATGFRATVNFGSPVLATYPTGFSSYGPLVTSDAPSTWANSSFLTWSIRTPT